MIRLCSLEETPKMLRKTLYHDDDVFIQAREFYQWNKDMRHHKILVYKDRKPAYVLAYQKNEPVGLDKHSPMVQMSLSNFWDYDINGNDCDFTYVDRFDLIIFENLEEYSWASARQIIDQNRNIRIAFLDKNASLFFNDEEVMIAESEEELFERYPELKDKKILRVHSEMKWNVSEFFANRVPSVMVLTSLYWLKRKFSYGPLNPQKTFYLIKQPVKENGFTNIAANVIGMVQMLKKSHPEIVPVVDLGINKDMNQFTYGNGEDVWRMFFKDISDVSLEEVYNSQNVILDQNSNINFNPYLTEFVLGGQQSTVRYKGILEYQDEVKEYVDNKLKDVFPEGKRVLGVIARGTDYFTERTKKYVPKAISNEELLEKVKAHMANDNFDYLFLATEDLSVLKMYEESELKDKLIYLEQDRVDYQAEENNGKVLIEIFAVERKDPYLRTLNYISVLEALKRCNALCANTRCGALNYVLGFEPEYEFVDVE